MRGGLVRRLPRRVHNGDVMRRILAVLFGVVVIALGGGFLALGAFPPKAPARLVHEAVSTQRLEQANAPPVPVLPPVPIPAAVPAPVSPPVPAPVQTPAPAPVPVPAPAAVPAPAPAPATPGH